MKEEIRRLVRSVKNNHSSRELAEKSAAIVSRLFESREYKKAGTVMFYASKEREVDTLPAIKRALEEKIVVVPFVSGDAIIPVRIRSLKELAPGSFGVPEPAREVVGEKKNRISPGRIDLVIVPGAAFDEEGNRVGYGKGYYDKFLKKTRKAATIALAYEFQMVPGIPASGHDVTVQKIITEKRIIDCAKNRGVQSNRGVRSPCAE